MQFESNSKGFCYFCIVILLVLSNLCQIIIGAIYQNFIKETENLSSTENRILKQCKLKFVNCYDLNEGNVNVTAFVEKFINQIRIGTMPLNGLSHLSGQLLLLSVFVAGAAACKGIIDGQTIGQLLPYYMLSLVGMYLYFSISSIIDTKGKKQTIKTNLVDYLENHMMKHLLFINKEEMKTYIIKNQKEEEKNKINNIVENKAENKDMNKKIEGTFSIEEKQVLEDFLKELLF